MTSVVDIAIPLATVLLLTAVGLDLTTADFGSVRHQPRIVAIGLFARFTVAAEFATRNVAVATTVAVTLLHRTDFAVFAVTYFITEVPLMRIAIGVFCSKSAT